MKIQIVKKYQYKGHEILIQRIGNLFEFMLVYKGRLYGHYLDIKPLWYRKYMSEPFTESQLEDAVKLIGAYAQDTVEQLSGKKQYIQSVKE